MLRGPVFLSDKYIFLCRRDTRVLVDSSSSAFSLVEIKESQKSLFLHHLI